MCEEPKMEFLDGDVVWVKLGPCWWPGKVVGFEKLPNDIVASFRKPPIAVVKFFQEDTYEYVKNVSNIYKYNCSRKTEFIQKGLYMYRNKRGQMEKFPEDVVLAEKATEGDENILSRDEFQETKKESYAGLFGNSAKKPVTSAKKGRPSKNTPQASPTSITPQKKLRRNFDYKVHILVQESNESLKAENISTPSTSRKLSETENTTTPVSNYTPTTTNSENVYSCHACSFSTTRLNVMILHNKSHSSSFVPYTPSAPKSVMTNRKSPNKTPKTAKHIKSPKTKKVKEGEDDKRPKKPQSATKRAATDQLVIEEAKKLKTDEEIKSSILADWEDIEDEANNDALESGSISKTESGEVLCDQPTVSVSEDPCAGNPEQVDKAEVTNKLQNESPNDSKYDFREDEDWPLEADVGRKIPRVKNSAKNKQDVKRHSFDEDSVAKEVDDLLSKTSVPELPIVPEPPKFEENFPDLSIAKSPDKNQASAEKNSSPPSTVSVIDTQSTKPIFKTKTFFRSRHSRSQDVIGKYVAEQLNAERIDIPESEINGAEIAQVPEERTSPPAEPIKVARLAPKIQLKKMKAEAAQMKEKEQTNLINFHLNANNEANETNIISPRSETPDATLSVKNILYPSQDIKPIINKDVEQEKPSDVEIKEHLMDKVLDKKQSNISNDINQSLSNDYKTAKNENNLELNSNLSSSRSLAVNALLSVSRENDQVTKMISIDPPEDLFDEDLKETVILNNKCNKSDNKESIETQKAHENKQEAPETAPRPLVANQAINESNNKDLKSEESENFKLTEPISEFDQKSSQDCLSKGEEKNTICVPSESDLQIAEALINLPSTAMQNNSLDKSVCMNDSKDNVINLKKTIYIDNTDIVKNPEVTEQSLSTNTNHRFESEEEKNKNLNAAQSLVEMSESHDHNIIVEKSSEIDTIIQKPLAEEKPFNINADIKVKSDQLLNKIHEIPTPKLTEVIPNQVQKQSKLDVKIKSNSVVKEKILNFSVDEPQLKKGMPKQKIIIRRTNSNKTLAPNLNKNCSQEKIVLSPLKTCDSKDGRTIQTYTIKSPEESFSNSNPIMLQQKMPNTSLKQKIKTNKTSLNNSKILVESSSAKQSQELLDIISMPVVLSEDILTPESIEKMPIVMSDGKLANTFSNNIQENAGNIIEKPKQNISSSNKQEMKTLLINSTTEAKSATPNILSKSSKLRNAKPMLVIDKTTGKQKFIITRAQPSAIKEIKQLPKTQQTTTPQTKITPKTENIILLPASGPSRTAKPQKIVIDPQSGKAHVIVSQTKESPINKVTEGPTTIKKNKNIQPRLIAKSMNATSSCNNTVMIITNAQGAQSRILLTAEHEKMLFPNKQITNISQMKTIQQVTTNPSVKKTPSNPIKAQPKVISKNRTPIITSKGQLIIGGSVPTTGQNTIALTEIRPVQKRIVTETKRVINTVKKPPNQPVIYFQQKTGTIMQLTPSQFEHLQKTGQIIQKTASPSTAQQENKVAAKEAIAISQKEPKVARTQKNKRISNEQPIQPKKAKKEILVSTHSVPVPTLAPLSSAISIPPASNEVLIGTSSYSELDNLEELLPSTAIVKQPEAVAQVPPPPPAPATISDNQILAVPGEHFGGAPGSFYLCVEEPVGTFTAIDNRPLVLENNQLVPMVAEPLAVLGSQPERRDILEAALASSDVFHADTTRDDRLDFRDLNANVSVNSRVSETSTTLNQPIMTPVEMPSKADGEPAVPVNLEDGLAVIGVTPHTVPTSLELPITVTDPRIAPKTTDPLSNNNYGPTLLPSPNRDIKYVTSDIETRISGPISMPLLTDDETVGKSMPILTDEIVERTVSSVESIVLSPSSNGVRETEVDNCTSWSHSLLTPGSDSSETSAEIPLQPNLQLSTEDLAHHS